MPTNCLLNTNDLIDEQLAAEQEPVFCPKASTCTWCGTYMVFDDHCKTRDQAARCPRYKGPKKK